MFYEDLNDIPIGTIIEVLDNNDANWLKVGDIVTITGFDVEDIVGKSNTEYSGLNGIVFKTNIIHSGNDWWMARRSDFKILITSNPNKVLLDELDLKIEAMERRLNGGSN